MGLDIDRAKASLFMHYLKDLKAWNKQFNLTSVTDERDIVVKHFLDSISILSKFNIPKNCLAVDIGTGAGFPGIPIKIMRPDIQMTLIESSLKKTRFLKHLIKAFALEGVNVYTGRAEDFGREKENREIFSLAVSRAVASIAILVEYALPLLKVDGRFVCYKSTGVLGEVSGAQKAINLLGGRVEEIAKVVVPFLKAERYLVSVIKVAPSPHSYPRRAGVPAKKPLV